MIGTAKFDAGYSLAEHVQFIEDMLRVKKPVQYYSGNGNYKGPAVRTTNLQVALSATKVPCTWEVCGKYWVVHPKKADYSLE